MGENQSEEGGIKDELLTRDEFLIRYEADRVGVGSSDELNRPQLDVPPSVKGYRVSVEDIRNREFKRLNDQPHLKGELNPVQVYLDNSANPLYPEGLVAAIRDDLTNNVYSNPHSHSPSADKTRLKVELVRRRVLEFFMADPKDYAVIFTQSATKAMQLVAETFPWSLGGTPEASKFFCPHNAHTSMLGMRGPAIERGATFVPIHLRQGDDPILEAFEFARGVVAKAYPKEGYTGELAPPTAGLPFHLFAYPGQCNFSGQKFRQTLPNTQDSAAMRILVLLDGASLASTSPIALIDRTRLTNPQLGHEVPPHFMAVSFYKIFGLPTGLGALIARKDALRVLASQKRYFGGGAVSSISASEAWTEPHASLTRQFEDGTLNFLDIIGLGIAIDYHRGLYGAMAAVRSHTHSLAHYVYSAMAAMRHFNGAPVFALYPARRAGWGGVDAFGPTIAFNILRPDASVVGSGGAHRAMAAAGFHLRSGTFCNPGGLSAYLAQHGPSGVARLVAHRCGEERDLDASGLPLGALRISLGAYSTFEDARRWLAFLVDGFVARQSTPLQVKNAGAPHLASIAIYPIKSCRGFQPTGGWPLGPWGLQYDRTWMLIAPDSNGEYSAINQKRVPRMALIAPKVVGDWLQVSAPGMPDEVAVDLSGADVGPEVAVRVMGRRVSANCYARPEVDAWFATVLGVPCRLARSNSDANHLANEAPLLLVTEPSLLQLGSQIPDAFSRAGGELGSAFRANFVVGGGLPYAEDGAGGVRVGSQIFRVLGRCRRCRMVNVCQSTGDVLPEPYLTLSKYRSFKGQIYFGVHLAHLPDLSAAPATVARNSEVEFIEDLKLLGTV
ncbi:hypothetical protein L0F63_001682 [Massospora cicadina]|nr:hypothetical protein L0F63_001682 [Massospora cicadina]